MQNLKSLYFLALCVVPLLLTGCSVTPPTVVTHDTIQFKGDATPLVSSRQVLANDYSNLSEGEATVAAIGKDGSGALSQPNLVSANIVETVLAKKDFEDNLALIMKRCDPDGDGIIDMLCPDLFAFIRSNKLSNFQNSDVLVKEKFVLFQSGYRIARQKSQKILEKSITFDVARENTQEVPMKLLLRSINRGNKSFDGDLIIRANIPPQVKLSEVTAKRKVRDNSERNQQLKSSLGAIPYIGLFTLWLDVGEAAIDPVETNAVFVSEISSEGNLNLTVKDIKIDPDEGVEIEYMVTYDIAGVAL